MTFILGMATGAVLMFFFLALVGELEFETTYEVVPDDSTKRMGQ